MACFTPEAVAKLSLILQYMYVRMYVTKPAKLCPQTWIRLLECSLLIMYNVTVNHYFVSLVYKQGLGGDRYTSWQAVLFLTIHF